SSPILITLFEKQTEKQFLALFEQDILLLQNNTIDKYEYNRIIFRDDHYELMFNDKNIANIVRHYPIDLSLSYNNTPIISFNDTGTIINPGTLKVKSKYT